MTWRQNHLWRDSQWSEGGCIEGREGGRGYAEASLPLAALGAMEVSVVLRRAKPILFAFVFVAK